MKKKQKMFLGFTVIALMVIFTFIGCDTGDGGEKNEAKTLIIQNIPGNIFTYARIYGGKLGIYPTGTTLQQALTLTGVVAGANLKNSDIIIVGSGPYTVTIPLYNLNNNNRWTGSGTFTAYVEFGGGGGYYRVSSVDIASGTTTISFSSATEVFP